MLLLFRLENATNVPGTGASGRSFRFCGPWPVTFAMAGAAIKVASRESAPRVKLRIKKDWQMIWRLTRVLAVAVLPLPVASHAAAEPETVYFKSADGQTEIIGYLFKPATYAPRGDVVMLHGRAGPYSANVNKDCALVSREAPSICNAGTLSKRHVMWGEYWAA